MIRLITIVKIMRLSRSDVLKNRVRLEDAIQKVTRDVGIDKLTVSNVAAEAGLTHGAAYRHYSDRNELVQSGISASFTKVFKWLDKLSKQPNPINQYIKAYLTARHRDRSSWGCPLPIVGANVNTQTKEVQATFATEFEALVGKLRQLDTKDPLNREQTIFLLAALSGAQMLARATRETDPELSKSILRSVEPNLLRK